MPGHIRETKDTTIPQQNRTQGKMKGTLQGSTLETVTNTTSLKMNGAPYQEWGMQQSQEWSNLTNKISLTMARPKETTYKFTPT